MRLNIFDVRAGFIDLFFGKGKARGVAPMGDGFQLLHPIRVAAIGLLVKAKGVQRLPIGSGHDRHIIGRLHPSLNLDAGDARRQDLRQMFQQT